MYELFKNKDFRIFKFKRKNAKFGIQALGKIALNLPGEIPVTAALLRACAWINK